MVLVLVLLAFLLFFLSSLLSLCFLLLLADYHVLLESLLKGSLRPEGTFVIETECLHRIIHRVHRLHLLLQANEGAGVGLMEKAAAGSQ